ncbi:hypothetical protein [Aromatoleum anaerobium]|uniref:hypothetical protein n=1 Tax=Aromatoleum anaerobium TaxID=182180 RepID=UPI001B7D2116|nr:hypothetical protein [Aromatoleum anaerobium]MCK0508027.1 hypothetical protein [Aromatoleum anaerobium]
MLELILATVAVIAALTLSSAFGRRRKREGLAWVEAQPENVVRLYLRAAADTDAYWLHAQMRNGKKRTIAAPWELDDTLRRLAVLGLALSADDRVALDASLARRADRRQDEGGRRARSGAFGGGAAT